MQNLPLKSAEEEVEGDYERVDEEEVEKGHPHRVLHVLED